MRLLVALLALAAGCLPDAVSETAWHPDAGGRAAEGTRALPLPLRDGERIWLGRLPRLRMAAFGDTRPVSPDAPYPFETVSSIFAGVALGARPDFLLFLGDAVYVSPARYEPARAQMRRFLQARAGFPGPVYFAVGNHEGFGENLRAFRDTVQPAAYYELGADTDAGEAKIVVIADNAFDARQESWLRQVLARRTALTVVVRHYPSYNLEYRNPEITDIVRAAAPTLVLAGHTHGYRRPAAREVVAGTGGAPLARLDDFHGFVRIELADTGAFTVRAFRAEGDLVDAFEVR